ncbi:MAG TPA: DUF262 domain-containing HNH endonuclease family protein [Ktedonobacterales bacterium]|nr:DUF262 domain-containing HNH endonuclease family protein [Ktedonobacterales bacterium]
MARVDIKGEQHPVIEVFSERYAFVVPPYQRPYAWTTEHASELFDDLLGYLGDGDGAVDELNPYFLGSIVLIKGDRPEAQIVDGQQRLITLTILLAALRAVVPPEYAESITRRLYEPADPLNNIPARYRLRPKERDAAFFQQFIQSENAIQRLQGQPHAELTESQRNMYENALLYLRLLREMPEPRRVRLAQFLAQRCLLVVVSTPDLSSAYRIFSVLNDRGLDLSYADILKAEVIGQLPEVQQYEYTLRWEQVEESLGRDAFNDLIGHIRSIYRRTRKRGDILDSFRQDVIHALNDSRRLIDEALVPYGASYYIILNAVYEHQDAPLAAKINQTLRWLNRIDNADWAPPALMFLQRYHDQPERLARFFADLERLAASLMIRRQYGHRREPRYWRIQAVIRQGEDLSHPDSPMQLTQHEREETIQTLGGDVYLMPAPPRNYLLQRLDSALAGSGATYDAHIITVEHVLPRNPPEKSEWTQWFPSPALRARWTHKLGNLALLSRVKNMQAVNYSFAVKKRTYFATKDGVSPFALTTQVLREEVWTPQVVERRQRELVGMLTQIWRL